MIYTISVVHKVQRRKFFLKVNLILVRKIKVFLQEKLSCSVYLSEPESSTMLLGEMMSHSFLSFFFFTVKIYVKIKGVR